MGYEIKNIADVTLYDTRTGEKIMQLDSLKVIDGGFTNTFKDMPIWNLPKEIKITLQDTCFNPQTLKALTCIKRTLFKPPASDKMQHVSWRYISYANGKN